MICPVVPLSCFEQLDVLCCAASGLRGAEVRIDCTITDGPRSPAHVIMYAEAKFKLQSTSEIDEAVGQIWVSLFSNAAALYSVAICGAASDSHEKYSMLKNYNNCSACNCIACSKGWTSLPVTKTCGRPGQWQSSATTAFSSGSFARTRTGASTPLYYLSR